MPTIVITVREACEQLRICRATFYNLVNQGEIPLRKIGSKSVVKTSDLHAFVDKTARSPGISLSANGSTQ